MQVAKKDLNRTKPKTFKSIIGKGATAKCLVCEDETIYVGKLNFIREHQPGK
jgi:Cd2+/Zn2+-exporting ATPase